MFNFQVGYSRVFSVLLFLTLLVLQTLDETNSGSNTARAQTISPQLRALIGPTDCLSNKGFGLSASDVSLMENLQKAVGGGVAFSCHLATGKVRFLGTSATRPVPFSASLPGQANPEQAARSFLDTYGGLFGLKNQAIGLKLEASLRANPNQKANFVRFQQVYKGIPVLAGEMIVQVGLNNEIISVGGELTPEEELDVTPQINEAKAQDTAKAEIAKVYNLQPSDLVTTRPELWIYNPGLINSQPVSFNRVVWRMTITSQTPFAGSEPFEELVLVDIKTGSIVLNFNQIAKAKNRQICNLNNASFAAGSEPDCTSPVRSEGQAASGVAEVNLAYDYSGATYDFYLNNFGRDSLDGLGLPLKNTVKVCLDGYSCPFANAFWSRTRFQMYFGESYVSADDIVGHELTHGFTQFTSNLLSHFQSGAINESISDVFGEFIDQTDGVDGSAGSGVGNRWLVGEDLPSRAIRDMRNPENFFNPDRISSTYYERSYGDNGGVHTNSGVNNKAAYLIVDGTSGETGSAFNGQTIQGIGIPKTARIYYEVEIHLLTSGSDYQDLYDYLPQACQNLIGSFSIVQTDCDQVKKAVIATEMNLTPVGYKTEAPICEAGSSPNNLFFDDLENTASGNWNFSATTGSNAWSYSNFNYNTSGTHHLWGMDQATLSDSNASMARGVVIPANAFLHFRHYFYFDAGYSLDGGVMEYSTDAGSSWLDAGSLFDTNGYTGTLNPNGDNPLAGRAAFTTLSVVYYSSRLNLNVLSGQTVRFRFRVGTNTGNVSGGDGWFVEDVRIYTCSAPSNCLTVTSSLDTNVCGTFRYAVGLANAGTGSQFKTINLTTLTSGTTINLMGSGITLESGVTLNGPPCNGPGPTLTINGGGITGVGLTLNGVSVNNIKVTGFNGVQIKANSGRNVLSCVQAVQ